MFPGGGIRLHTTRTSCHRKLQVWYLVEIMVIIEKNQQSESLLARWRFYSTACDACLSITWFVTRWKYSWVKCFFFSLFLLFYSLLGNFHVNFYNRILKLLNQSLSYFSWIENISVWKKYFIVVRVACIINS